MIACETATASPDASGLDAIGALPISWVREARVGRGAPCEDCDLDTGGDGTTGVLRVTTMVVNSNVCLQ